MTETPETVTILLPPEPAREHPRRYVALTLDVPLVESIQAALYASRDLSRKLDRPPEAPRFHAVALRPPLCHLVDMPEEMDRRIEARWQEETGFPEVAPIGPTIAAELRLAGVVGEGPMLFVTPVCTYVRTDSMETEAFDHVDLLCYQLMLSPAADVGALFGRIAAESPERACWLLEHGRSAVGEPRRPMTPLPKSSLLPLLRSPRSDLRQQAFRHLSATEEPDGKPRR